MRLFKTSSKLTSLKNGCLFISSASVLPDPSRRVGSRVNNYDYVSRRQHDMQARTFCRIDTASLGIVMGYSGSSSRIASNISSSSSPRKGDCPRSISYISTPNAHQSTARP